MADTEKSLESIMAEMDKKGYKHVEYFYMRTGCYYFYKETHQCPKMKERDKRLKICYIDYITCGFREKDGFDLSEDSPLGIKFAVYTDDLPDYDDYIFEDTYLFCPFCGINIIKE